MVEKIQSVHKSVEDIFLRRNPNCKEKELNWRADERLEWICPHGVGHTVFSPTREEEPEGHWIHGCDGCCKGLVTFLIKFNVPKKGGKN